MKKAIALFDIDGTIIRDRSAERVFVRYLLSRGELNVRNGANFLLHFLWALPRSRVMATKGNRFYLKGKDSARIEQLAEECFREEIVPRVSDVARGKMEEHRVNRLEIVLLSGTPDVLLRCFQEYLRADHAHGSTLTVVEGRYTGGLSGPYPYGRAKAEIVKAQYGPEAYDLSASYAYADHSSDFEFLRLFGHPTLVNPNPQLAAKAREMGMRTAQF